jgi:hypothetical protein
MKRKWFEMIACGEKKEEYREIKEYWIKRFVEGFKGTEIVWRKYHKVIAKNGYSKTPPTIHWEHLGITIGEPNPSWCEAKDVGKKVFILKIGDILYDSRRHE